MKKIGIYIHIPFCKQKCKYCDFISFYKDEKVQKKYIEALIKEIKEKDFDKKEMQNQNINKGKIKVSTIYIGGGTPSFIDSKYIVEILQEIKNKYEIEEFAEITIEINPGTITKQKLVDYKNAGINRISIGLQSTENRILKLIGRIHTYEEFLYTYNLVKEVGFENINIDLMLAIPTQTEKELKDGIIKVINLEPQHISLYSLILEEGTELEKLVSKGELKLLEEEQERNMYWSAKRILEKNGYCHYEISNFSKKGYESKHNNDCWNQEEYIGFGLAAHSYFDNKRFSNIDCFDKYIQNIEMNKIDENIEIHEEQDREAKAKEFMMLGLRKIEGVSISEFERRFRVHPLFYFRFEISKLEELGLLEVDLDKIKLTKKGLDLANKVFEEFV